MNENLLLHLMFLFLLFPPPPPPPPHPPALNFDFNCFVLFFVCVKLELTKQQNDFKIKLKELEDSLLSRLSSAESNFLGDTALVENLETTKRTAAEIEQKVSTVTLQPCIRS